GNALVGIHIQPVLMTLLALGLWAVFRATPPLVTPVLDARNGASPPVEHRWLQVRRAAGGALGVLVLPMAMLVVGLGLAAAQLLPLYELSRFSARSDGVSYEFATSYGPTPDNLISLIFPAFFQGVGNQWWSLWSKWESTIYVGVAPLALAVVATAFRRSRETWFFAGLAVASLLLALADYSPLKLYWLVWHLPGFSSTRAPGRFSLLFTLAVAMLAAYGMQWLASHLDPRRQSAAPRRRLSDPFVRIRLLAFAAGCGAVVAAVSVVLL